LPFGCSNRRALTGAVAALLLLAACKGDQRRPTSSPASTAAAASGLVRIGVWEPADPATSSYGGAATRSLIYPQLFEATPDGAWEASIVVKGSDHTAADARSARFRIRPDARWTDGSRVGVRDLRRTMDPRFVTKIDAPNARGEVVVHFTQRLPGWRRMWSGLDAIAPPKDGVYGGPYKLDHVTNGLETVLVANPRYFAPPHIREVRFVLVPQGEVAVRLMDRGELDVIAPPAFTDRTKRLESIKDAHVLRGRPGRGGLTVALVANPARLATPQRQALLSIVDTKRFVDVVLHDEATFEGVSSASVAPTPTSVVPAISEPVESAPVTQFVHAMQRRGRKTGITFDTRQGEFDQILGSYARSDFDVFVRIQPTLPDRCWICEASTVDATLAAQADAHVKDAAERLEKEMLDAAIVVPLWREVPVVAVRDGLDGVEVNGFDIAGPAGNIAEWRWNRA
jgi:ABC-type transport system substrate-binding protein